MLKASFRPFEHCAIIILLDTFRFTSIPDTFHSRRSTVLAPYFYFRAGDSTALQSRKLLLLRQLGNTGQSLAFQQLQRSTTTSGNVAQFVLLTGLGDKGSSVTTTNNDSGAVLGGLDTGLEKGVGATSKRRELKDTSRAVPEDGLGLSNGLSKEFSGLGSTVETHPVRGDTRLVSSRAGLVQCQQDFM